MSQLHIAAPHLTAPFILLDAASAAAAAWTTRRPSQGALCKGKFAGHPALSSSAYRIFYLGPLPLQTRLNPVLRIAHRGCPNWRHITGRSLSTHGRSLYVSPDTLRSSPRTATPRDKTVACTFLSYTNQEEIIPEQDPFVCLVRNFCSSDSLAQRLSVQSCAKTVRTGTSMDARIHGSR